jgi:hypothetical protein
MSDGEKQQMVVSDNEEGYPQSEEEYEEEQHQALQPQPRSQAPAQQQGQRTMQRARQQPQQQQQQQQQNPLPSNNIYNQQMMPQQQERVTGFPGRSRLLVMVGGGQACPELSLRSHRVGHSRVLGSVWGATYHD